MVRYRRGPGLCAFGLLRSRAGISGRRAQKLTQQDAPRRLPAPQARRYAVPSGPWTTSLGEDSPAPIGWMAGLRVLAYKPNLRCQRPAATGADPPAIGTIELLRRRRSLV